MPVLRKGFLKMTVIGTDRKNVKEEKNQMKKILLATLCILSLSLLSIAQENWEFSTHYSYWGMGYFIANPENDVSDAFDAYDGPIEFETYGHNFGFTLRFFPGGKQGSFSLGFSYERNYFKADIKGSYSEAITNGAITKAGSGYIDLTPHSFNLDVRWEILPNSRLHPYAGIGVGVGPQRGNIVFTTVTDTKIGGVITSETETEELTLKEAIKKIERAQEKDEDEDYYMVDFFPIVYLNLGLRAEVARNFYLMGEIAVYDGFIARAGVAFRF